jgi:hypothetical protein
MAPVNPNRPYRERFLDNFDRSQLRRKVEAVRPRRFAGLKKKYATWALGASLAIGGIGTPLKMVQQGSGGSADPGSPGEVSTVLDSALARDIEASQSIASQVAGGVSAAAGGVKGAVSSPLQKIGSAPRQLAIMTEKVREDFFRTEVPFGSIIYQEAKKNDLRPELVAAVVQAESQFKPRARSGAGAVGLMQLVPRTGRWMGARDLTNPVQNISAGTKYLKYLNERFDGNETQVIAAYNAGEGNVKRFGGVPPFKETRNYVKKVKNFEKEYHARVENRAGEVGAAITGEEPELAR